MSDSVLITRCPHCNVAFKLRPEHLTVAAGKVRCGACLTIFLGADYLEQGQLPNQNEQPKDIVEDTVVENDGSESTSPTAENGSITGILDSVNNADDAHQTQSQLSNSETLAEPPSLTTFLDDDLLTKTHSSPPKLLTQKAVLTLVALICVTGLLLTAQWLHFNSDRLSQQLAYHENIASFCNITGCELSPLLEPDKVAIENLTVRSHSSVDKALTLELRLINNATFPQPFPKLALVFTDIEDNVVAKRLFETHDYLKGDLLGATMMPPQQPVRVVIDIVDPSGADITLNYRLEPVFN